MSNNWKDTIQKWFKNLLLPDLNKRITWYLVIIGTGILITPTALEEYIFRWIFEYLNSTKLSDQKINFTIENNNPLIGLTIIILALVHNVTIQYLNEKKHSNLEPKINDSLDADRITYQEFIDLLGSNSNEINLLRNHNFGNSYPNEYTDGLLKYFHYWNIPEKHFFDEEIEQKRIQFFEDLSRFLNKLVTTAGSIGNGTMRSVIPNEYLGYEFNIPERVQNDVKEINELANKAFKSHQELILLGRQKFSI